MLDYFKITLKSHSAVKLYNFVIIVMDVKRFPKICKPPLVYWFYCMALFHSQMQRHMIKVFSVWVISFWYFKSVQDTTGLLNW